MYLDMKTNNFIQSYVSKETNQDILNLFLITQTKNQHYVLIKDIKSECTEKSSKVGKSWPQLKT